MIGSQTKFSMIKIFYNKKEHYNYEPTSKVEHGSTAQQVLINHNHWGTEEAVYLQDIQKNNNNKIKLYFTWKTDQLIHIAKCWYKQVTIAYKVIIIQNTMYITQIYAIKEENLHAKFVYIVSYPSQLRI